MVIDADLALVVGLVIGVFAIPAMVSAFSEGRTPRIAAIVVILSGGLIVYAMTNKTGGYTIEQIPDTVVKVIGRYIN